MRHRTRMIAAAAVVTAALAAGSTAAVASATGRHRTPPVASPAALEPGIGSPQVNPLVHPDLAAPQRRQDAPLGGAPHLRRRYPGGVSRLLERGRRAHLVLI